MVEYAINGHIGGRYILGIHTQWLRDIIFTYCTSHEPAF